MGSAAEAQAGVKFLITQACRTLTVSVDCFRHFWEATNSLPIRQIVYQSIGHKSKRETRRDPMIIPIDLCTVCVAGVTLFIGASELTDVGVLPALLQSLVSVAKG